MTLFYRQSGPQRHFQQTQANGTNPTPPNGEPARIKQAAPFGNKPPKKKMEYKKNGTTPSPLACHALDDLYGQDSVRSSDGFDGMYNEGDSDGLDCY